MDQGTGCAVDQGGVADVFMTAIPCQYMLWRKQTDRHVVVEVSAGAWHGTEHELFDKCKGLLQLFRKAARHLHIQSNVYISLEMKRGSNPYCDYQWEPALPSHPPCNQYVTSYNFRYRFTVTSAQAQFVTALLNHTRLVLSAAETQLW